MKSILVFAIICSSFNFALAQDTITLNSGEIIPAKVISVSDDFIEYKKSEYMEGPVFKSQIKNVESLSLNGEEHSSKSIVSSGEQGQIAFERRHFVGLGTGVFINPEADDVAFLFKLDGYYFFTPVFGLGLNSTIYQEGFSFSVVGNSPVRALNGAPSFIYKAEKVRFTHIMINPIFSLPLKYFSLDYKMAVGYTRLSVGEIDQAFLNSNGNSYNYRIEKSATGGYSFGGGMAMRFNLVKDNPISFAFGVDYIATVIKPKFDVTAYDAKTNQSYSYSDADQKFYSTINTFIQLTYQINQPK